MEKIEILPEIGKPKFTLIYWKGEKYWLGKLLEYPDIMTQGETLEELEDNIREAFYLMNMEDVPNDYQIKELAL
jgi:hypothetical protein